MPEIGNNLIVGTIPIELFEIPTSNSIDVISLSENLLVGSVPPTIENLVNAIGIDLALNQLTGSIPTEIGLLSELETLYLRHNELRYVEEGFHISAPIPKLNSLLSHPCNILLHCSRFISGAMPSEIGNCAELETLYVHYNKLQGTIPSELFTGPIRRSMEVLVLSHNMFSGTLPGEAMIEATNLMLLHVDFNHFSGTIPATVTYMTNLGKYMRIFCDLL